MPDQEKNQAELENLEVTELEDGDLDEVAGGSGSIREIDGDTINNQCTNTGC